MRYLFLFALLVVSFLSSGQKKNQKDTSAVLYQPKRIEFIRESGTSNFTLVNGAENGLLVIEDTDKTADGGSKWKFNLVDTTLNTFWSAEVSLPYEYSLIGYANHGKDFILLFQTKFFGTEDLAAFKINTDSDDILKYEITTVFPVELTHFEVIDEVIILAGYANFRPVVITYNLNDRIPRILPGFYDNKNQILDVLIDKENELFSVITAEKMKSKYYTVRLRTYTSSGDLLVDNTIDPGEKRSIIDAAVTNFSGGLQYLAGTHSKKSLDYSHGFYLSKFINGQQQVSKYYPFADLENFFSYLKPKREKRIKSRIDRKKEKGKTKKFSYRLLVHEILEYEDEYIMVAEAYYPKYNYGSQYNPGYIPRSLQEQFLFLGNVWTHAVVVAFDKNCNINWDNTFKIEDRISYGLEKTIQVSRVENNIILNYLEENEIRSKVINKEGVLEGKTFNPVRLSFETDEVRGYDSDFKGFEKWYGGTSIAYGEQSIKNMKSNESSISRDVFYINMVKYDTEELIN